MYIPTHLDQANLILTLKFAQASCSWAALWFLCVPTSTHRQQTSVFSSMQKSLSSSRCSLHFRDSGSFVTSTTVCSLKADLCWCRRAWAWHRDASQVRQVLMATDGVSMQWSQLMVENLDSLFGDAVCISAGAVLSGAMSFTLAWRLAFISSVRSEARSTRHSGQKRGTLLESSVSHTVRMQLRQKLCPHGSVTGSVKTSWHTGHSRDSSIASILLFAPVWQQLCVLLLAYLLMNVSQDSLGLHTILMCSSVRLLGKSWQPPGPVQAIHSQRATQTMSEMPRNIIWIKHISNILFYKHYIFNINEKVVNEVMYIHFPSINDK